MLHIVLHQPEIPQNAGNIGRTCMAAGADLHLIEPLGFRLNERALKRAGMDYWQEVDVKRHINFEAFVRAHPASRIWMATTKAIKSHTDAAFSDGDFIMFGKESGGIPEDILARYADTCIRIPMAEGARSLNLSNAVAIILYEAVRQIKPHSLR